jgi:type IV secretion system protein VirD4
MRVICHVLGVLLVMTIGFALATQWSAWQLGYARLLGYPVILFKGHPVYAPWSFVLWVIKYSKIYPVLFQKACVFPFISALVSLIYAYLLTKCRDKIPKTSGTHGSARWMEPQEIKHSILVNNPGVFLGKAGKYFLRHNGPEHVIAIAPTRSGKGVGLVIPTLLSWEESVLIYDIKGENWKITSGFRKRFSHCIYFNPTSDKSARFNPLLEVRKGAHEIQDVQNIADILVEPEGGSDKRDYWSKTGHVLLVASILHVLYVEDDKTLAGVANFLSDPCRDVEETLNIMMETKHLGDRPHPVIASAAREMLNKAHNELSGVVSTAMSFLGLYRDPIVARATSRSDFKIRDIMNADKPVSLYLVVPPSDLSRTRPLVRLMLNQICRGTTGVETTHDEKPYKHRLLMMIDEFPALGRLEFFETSIAFTASYGVKCYLIAQSLNQLDKIYGLHHSILDNCHVRVLFSTNDDRTAKRTSELLGQKTQSRKKVNHSGRATRIILNHISIGDEEVGRPLLTPGEVSTMPSSDALILVGGLPPIYAKKIRYYEDRNFIRRCLAEPYLTGEGDNDLPTASEEVVWLSRQFIREEIH